MQHANFVHLHIHTYYSLLDGAIPIQTLADISKKFKLPAVAMTDHGNLFGAVDFYKTVSKVGVKPIIGCEVYLLREGTRFEKHAIQKDGNILSHLVLLVKNQKGYKNLCKLVSSSYLEGFYYKPRIDKDILKQYNEGLICLSACLKGEISSLVLEGRIDDAEETIAWYSSIFDKERYYIEIMDHGLDEQKRVNPVLCDLAKKMSIPLVASNDSHYVARGDDKAHEALLCIQTGKTLDDPKRMRFSSDQFYLKSPDEMAALFSHVPEAISNTLEIAKRCNFEFDFKTYHFPKFEPPKGMDLPEFLTQKTHEGFENREATLLKKRHHSNWDELKPQYLDRLEEELDIIKNMGFAGYFLIVYDFINYAKTSGISVGPGRGSAAGSLVAYSLGITDLDPIDYNLLFERFLNPERVSMPDVDIDFCVRNRDKVIDYVAKKYGNVSQIITFGKMKARAVLRDVGRVMGLPYADVDRIAKLIPTALDMTLEKAIQVEAELKDLIEKDSQVAQLMGIAKKLEGFPRHASTHAAGVVISDQPLVNFLPLYKGQNNEIVTQFDMKFVESIGLIKFDFLGLKTLTLIDDTIKIIKEIRGLDIDIGSIPMDDSKVFELLCEGDTKGIFQLESSGMTDLIVRLKPEQFEEIIALVALYRPGPLGSGMVDDFIDRKHGRKEIEYELPELETILKDTYGVILYQEQVMQIASKLAAFSLGDADLLRRAMGKKKVEVMAKQREKFLSGCNQNKFQPAKANRIFDLMAEFAGYGFNKSHSAAYALVSYRTAYLKAHYTTEFMASLLTSEMGNNDKILEYMNDCRNHEIKILPPDVNQSEVNFTVVEQAEIRFGLAAVKNAGTSAIDEIVKVRKEQGKYTSLVDFCERIDSKKVNRRVLESLIKCGAMDSFNENRAELFANLDSSMGYGSARQKEREAGQVSMFDMIGISQNETSLSTKNKIEYEPWSERQQLSYEKEALGFYLTGHPLAQYESLVKQYTSDTIKTVSELSTKRDVKFAGVISTLKEIITKRGDKMAFVGIEDLCGMIEGVVFADLYQKTFTLLKGETPLFFKGVADVGEESVKVIVNDIFTIDDLPSNLTKSIHFYLSVVETDKKYFEHLKSVLKRYPGSCPSFVHITIPEKSETIMSLPKELHVTANLEMVKTLEKIFGHNITKFKS